MSLRLVAIAIAAASLVALSVVFGTHVPSRIFGFGSVSETVPETFMPTESRAVGILFGGDMMFDRWIREQATKRGNAFVFDGVQDEIRAHDLVVANLEGPITDRPSKSVSSEIGSRENYHFTFDPSWARTLSDEGIGPVFLGNNHIRNEGDSGLAQTKEYLDSAGITYFGDPSGVARIATVDIRGMRIAFVGYNAFEADGKESAFDDIRTADDSADIVILYAHWGTEYEPVRADIRSLAHAFVDAGCDAVIGSHPHVVQDSESYSGKTIYYSLGNFVFDQYFREETRRGLLVSMTIDPATGIVAFRDIPITLRTDGSTVLGSDPRTFR